MEPIVEARVMHLVGPVASTSPRVNCRAQVSCKSLRPRTGTTCSGPFTKPYGGRTWNHDTADYHRCAAVARRRVVRPRALVLVSEVFFWRSVMMRPSRPPRNPPEQAGKAARALAAVCRILKLCRSRQSTRTWSNGRGFDRSAIHTSICMEFPFAMGWVWFNRRLE